MSPRAERVAFLRGQLADLQDWLENWPASARRRHALRKRVLRSRDIVEDILRELGAALIAGAPL